MGKITGTEDNATKLVRWMEEKIEYVKKKVKGRKKVSVFGTIQFGLVERTHL